MHRHAHFLRLEEASQQDWQLIAGEFRRHAEHLPDRVIQHLQLLAGEHGGFPVDRYTHSLQTATRALRDGRDDEYVCCALLHDIGDTLGAYNHAEIAAAILRPFVSAENLWMVQHHSICQAYYFYQQLGLDRNSREQFREHPHFKRTVEFCTLYDNPSFDPHAETFPIAEFEPMLRRLFAAPRNASYLSAPSG
ncbi:MAG: HD domain-containing protein [Burkholderiales bacterium]|nr:HD domain-containing protein [Burkholderiales bacterium]